MARVLLLVLNFSQFFFRFEVNLVLLLFDHLVVKAEGASSGLIKILLGLVMTVFGHRDCCQ